MKLRSISLFLALLVLVPIVYAAVTGPEVITAESGIQSDGDGIPEAGEIVSTWAVFGGSVWDIQKVEIAIFDSFSFGLVAFQQWNGSTGRHQLDWTPTYPIPHWVFVRWWIASQQSNFFHAAYIE